MRCNQCDCAKSNSDNSQSKGTIVNAFDLLFHTPNVCWYSLGVLIVISCACYTNRRVKSDRNMIIPHGLDYSCAEFPRRLLDCSGPSIHIQTARLLFRHHHYSATFCGVNLYISTARARASSVLNNVRSVCKCVCVCLCNVGS